MLPHGSGLPDLPERQRANLEWRAPVSAQLHVDGVLLSVPDGMTLAAALVQAGVRAVSVNPVSGQARGPFCGMGICFECEVLMDGRPVRACLTPVTDGMKIEIAAETQ